MSLRAQNSAWWKTAFMKKNKSNCCTEQRKVEVDRFFSDLNWPFTKRNATKCLLIKLLCQYLFSKLAFFKGFNISSGQVCSIENPLE